MFQLNKLKLDKFLIINGGYPGVLYNLLIAKSWKKYKYKSAWMVVHNYPKKYNLFNYFVQSIIDYYFSLNLSGIVTVSNSGLKSIKKRNFVKKLKLRIIYNGVNKLRANKVLKIKIN